MLQRLIYRLYQRSLEHAVRNGQMPRHVGVVLDGNRRFARKAGLLGGVAEGHRAGADRAEALIDWCDELGVPVVTVWALSTDNFKRDPEELESIFALVEDKIDALAKAQSRSNRRRVRAVGRLELLPESTRAAIGRIEAETAENGPYELIVAVGYGGREEITDAVKRMIAERLREGDSLEGIADSLEPDEIGRYMYAPDVPDPDLIIRTSGEVRLSGFLLWQSAYSEYYFCDVFWPEFRKIDFLRAIRSYSQRQRRKGA
ncbi:MAG TPA: polyprenyl diphosphate synthase [Dehalococcoidia bacterium]|nr:polyprenyl diphosphate synthase [Dehalococcoidia bacterium]